MLNAGLVLGYIGPGAGFLFQMPYLPFTIAAAALLVVLLVTLVRGIVRRSQEKPS